MAEPVPTEHTTYIYHSDNVNDEIEIALQYTVKYNIDIDDPDDITISNFKKDLQDNTNILETNIGQYVQTAYNFNTPNIEHTHVKQDDTRAEKIYGINYANVHEWQGMFRFIEDYTYPLTIIKPSANIPDVSIENTTIFTIEVNEIQDIIYRLKPGDQATYSPVFIEQSE